MDHWLDLIRASFQSEKGPPLGAFATVNHEGRPRVRYVVCHLESDGRIWFGTSARSNKNRHIRDNPQIELVFWTPSTSRQFRIEGIAEPVDNVQSLLKIWQGLTDGVRAFYFWPESGSAGRGDPSAFPAAVPATTPPPTTFEPIVVTPGRVEMLDISVHPHARRAWSRREGNWTAADATPQVRL